MEKKKNFSKGEFEFEEKQQQRSRDCTGSRYPHTIMSKQLDVSASAAKAVKEKLRQWAARGGLYMGSRSGRAAGSRVVNRIE